MARFLRDERPTNHTIDEEALIQIDAAFRSRIASMPEVASNNDDSYAVLFYIIRFDNKGYKVFSLQKSSALRSILSLRTALRPTSRKAATYCSGSMRKTRTTVGSQFPQK